MSPPVPRENRLVPRRTRRGKPLLLAVATLVLLLALVLAATFRLWIGLPGEWLVALDPLGPADAVVVLDIGEPDLMDQAEAWRQQALVQRVALIEVPIRTHALQARYSDFAALGLARSPATPPEHLSVVAARGNRLVDQVDAALLALEQNGSTTALIPVRSLSSRLLRNVLDDALVGRDLTVHVVALPNDTFRPSEWYADPFARRRVLNAWWQLLVPGLMGQD